MVSIAGMLYGRDRREMRSPEAEAAFYFRSGYGQYELDRMLWQEKVCFEAGMPAEAEHCRQVAVELQKLGMVCSQSSPMKSGLVGVYKDDGFGELIYAGYPAVEVLVD